MFGIGQPELILIIFIALLLFGPKTLPKMSRTLGDSLRALREGFNNGDNDKSLKEITKEVASSAREIRAGLNEVKHPISTMQNQPAQPSETQAGNNG